MAAPGGDLRRPAGLTRPMPGPADETDILVIGAGAAGIAAARAVQAAGCRVLVLEARSRVGGRAVTDTTRLGAPFDLGAAWRYVGDRYVDAANSTRLHAYMTADAWISVPYKQFVVTLRGSNLFDKTYGIFGSNFYPDQVLIGAPRTFELSVMGRF